MDLLAHSDVINAIGKSCKALDYLEIGVEAGITFNRVEIPNRVAVDPNFKVTPNQLKGEAVAITSDEYFDLHPGQRFDLVFVDGLHTFEQSLRDFCRAVQRLRPSGAVIMDDCNPSDDLAALRDHSECIRRKIERGDADRNWMGDVYKTVLWINDYLDLSYSYVEGTAGIVVVWFEPRKTKPIFDTILSLIACDYQEFKMLDLPTLSLGEITKRIASFVAPGQTRD